MKVRLKKIFSISNEYANDKKYKVITVLGFKLKFKIEEHINVALPPEIENIINCYKHGINKEKIAYEIENFEELGITEQKREQKIIVSLTSFPGRMYDLHYAIYSLLTQSVKPDELVLWLAKDEFEKCKISKKVLDLQKNGLTIKWCENLKSYKKLIPSLKEYPNDIIVTVDDDVYYPENWLEDLYEEYLKQPHLIHAKRCHKLALNTPYIKWKKCIDDNSISFKNFQTGVGGVLYPSKSLHKDVLDENLFRALAPNADDLLFWAMAVLNGTKIKVCKKSTKELTFTTPEREYGLYNEYALSQTNVSQNENDIQLENILNHYPQIKEIVEND